MRTDMFCETHHQAINIISEQHKVCNEFQLVVVAQLFNENLLITIFLDEILSFLAVVLWCYGYLPAFAEQDYVILVLDKDDSNTFVTEQPKLTTMVEIAIRQRIFFIFYNTLLSVEFRFRNFNSARNNVPSIEITTFLLSISLSP